MILAILAGAALTVGAYAIYKNRATIEADLRAKFGAKFDAVEADVKASIANLPAEVKAEVAKAIAYVKAELKKV